MAPCSKLRRIWRLVSFIALIAVLGCLTATIIATAGNKWNLPDSVFDYSVELPEHLQTKADTSAPANPRANDIATLGRVLFYDKNLSANNLVSCASCHKQANGFDDPARRSIGFKGLITRRSAMGLTNARFNSNGRYFWDERAASLEEQVLQPFFDPIEMGLKPGDLVEAARANTNYAELFHNAYGSLEISEAAIATALVGFINSIVSTTAPYDIARASAPDPLEDFEKFTALQNLGKKLFFASPDSGGAGCTSCHHSEKFISLPGGANNGLDAQTTTDQGTGAITRNSNDNGKFRPPSLRNIAVRAPYMHDGRFATLEAVIDHYSTGIKRHPNLGKALKNADGTPRRFDFSAIEKQALIAFLNTLSDQELLSDPKFSNPNQ